jgi:hypothetical protein
MNDGFDYEDMRLLSIFDTSAQSRNDAEYGMMV